MEEPRRSLDVLNGYRAIRRENERVRKLELRRFERDRLAKIEAQIREIRNGKKRPPESGMPAPVEPPKGPQPMQGGAAAPLDFD